MADVYSERFCLAHRPGHPLVTFTVPVGKRAIVKSFSYSGYATSNPAVWLAIADHYVSVSLPPGSTFGGVLELYQVAYAGERITVDCTASSGDVWASVSGYLLDDYTSRVTQLPGEGEATPPSPGPVDPADTVWACSPAR